MSSLSAPQGRVSAPLGCLRWCGFVARERIGRRTLYRVADPRVRTLLTTAQELLQDNAAWVATCWISDPREYTQEDPP